MAQSRRNATRRGAPKGPPTAQVLGPISSSVQLVDYKAIDANPEDWFATMRRADRGDTGPMIDLFSDARDRDAHLDGVVRKRVQSMMGRPILFRPAEGMEDDKDAKDNAKFVRRILLSESRDFRSMLAHLMAGAAYGYSVALLDWTINASNEWVPHLRWVHLNRFAFTSETLEIGFYDSPFRAHTSVKKLSNYPDRFVAHVPMGGRTDYPWRRGPMRSCIIPSFIKRKGLQFWLRLAERFGMPQPYATVPQGIDKASETNDDDTIAVVRDALLSLSTHWAAVFGEGVEISHIPGSGNVSAEVHKALMEWAETTQSISMLGQNLTTKVEGGSFAAAESHRFVAGDLHLADATELASTITQQIVEPIIRYNRPGSPIPVCEIGTGAKQVPSEKDVEMGTFSRDERRRMMGHESIADGSGSVYERTVSVQVPAQIGGRENTDDGAGVPKDEEENS